MKTHRAVLILSLAVVASSQAQESRPQNWHNTKPAWTACTFADGKQVILRYAPVQAVRDIPQGKPWAPDERPLTIFSEADLEIGELPVPRGVARLYLLSDDASWNLLVKRGSTKLISNAGDKEIGQVRMEADTLPVPQMRLQVYFAHAEGRRCRLRIDYGSRRMWVDLRER